MPVIFWIAIALFGITSVLDLLSGFYVEMTSAVCALLAFVLLAINVRQQLPAVRWSAYLLLAAALSIRILLLLNRHVYDYQLF